MKSLGQVLVSNHIAALIAAVTFLAFVAAGTLPAAEPHPGDTLRSGTPQLSDGNAPPAPRKPHFILERRPVAEDPARFDTSRTSPVRLPLPEEQDSFTFVVFGDRTGGPAEGIEVLKEAVRNVNLIEPDLVINVGDMVQGYNTTQEWLPQMREFRSVMKGLLCPWFPVPGNHDIYWRGPNRPSRENEANYEQHFGPLWYAFEHKDCWFIVLYSDEGNPETGEKNFSKPACQRMSPAQYEWLKSTLGKARGARHVFLFLHHPRWLGGGYGKDWERVHWLLSQAGNVSIVFGGHIHRMRYDGPHDGIEYVTLATTGGAQSGLAPRAGFLHHYHHVHVRGDRIALASVPVGEAMDVRSITGQVSDDAAKLASLKPRFEGLPRIDTTGRIDRPVTVSITNPAQHPLEVDLAIDSEDARWLGSPDQYRAVINAGESETFRFEIDRLCEDLGLDGGFRDAALVTRLNYLGEKISVPIPESRSVIPLRFELPAPPVPATEVALRLDGDDCLAIPNVFLDLPDGPFTLECWFNADSYEERTGLLAKTESSEFGFFVNRGLPEFSVFLGEAYVTAAAGQPILETGRWQHIAGVYDGTAVRLYVDGQLVGAAVASGARRKNSLPLLVGADVDRYGRATSHFTGQIDAVRLSAGAHYSGTSFTPQRRTAANEGTVLLLNMDGTVGPWIHDASSSSAHARLRGNPELVPAEE